MNKAELAFGGAELAFKSASASVKFIDEFLSGQTAIAGARESVMKIAPEKVVEALGFTTPGNLAPLSYGQKYAGSLASMSPKIDEMARIVRSTYRPGDAVSIEVGGNKSLGAEIVSFKKLTQGEEVAVLQVKEGSSIPARLPGNDLQKLTASLWRDETGAVFRTTQKVVDDIPHVDELRFVPNMFTAPTERMTLVDSTRAIRPFELSLSKLSDDLISKYAHARGGFLAAMQQAPEVAFSNANTSLVRSTLFNPTASKSNCMSCTAGVVRTLNSGKLFTAPAVESLGTKAGAFGAPYPGRFKTEPEALEWFAQAAGSRIASQPAKFADMIPETPYAAKLGLVAKNSDQSHMVFAYKPKDGAPFLYDAQNGIRYSPRSLERNGTPVALYQLESLAIK